MSKKNSKDESNGAIGFSGIHELLHEIEDPWATESNKIAGDKEANKHQNTSRTSQSKKSNSTLWISLWFILLLIVLVTIGSAGTYFGNESIGNKSNRESSNRYNPEVEISSYDNNFSKETRTLIENKTENSEKIRSSREKKTGGQSSANLPRERQVRLYSFPDLSIPPIESGYTLTQQQIQYCFAEKIRIESAHEQYQQRKKVVDWSLKPIEEFETYSRDRIREFGGFEAYNSTLKRLTLLLEGLHRMSDPLSEDRTFRQTLVFLHFKTISVQLKVGEIEINYRQSCKIFQYSVYCKELRKEVTTIVSNLKNILLATLENYPVRFNAMVNDYNGRCKYKAYQDEYDAALSVTESLRDRYKAEGLKMLE